MPWSSHLSQQVIIAECVSVAFASSSAVPFPWLLTGTLFPDYFLLAKAWIYFKDPTRARSGLLGAGHSILICTAVAAAISIFDRATSIAFFLGATSHVLSDTTDSKGCALLYPLANGRISLNMWPYSATEGLIGDLRSFCTNPVALIFESAFGVCAMTILTKWFSLV